MILILIFECIGGLNSVAFTDTIQAVIMLFAFVTIPILLTKHYGGWRDLTPETYPQPSFYQTPTAEEQWEFWQFALINFSFFTLPHFVQRVYAAKDLQSLKIGYLVLSVSPWTTMFVGVFIGTIGVAILVNPEDGTPIVPDDPFTAIMESLMDVGGFTEAVACIGVTASLAAIMSTADSLIIAISQLVTVEICYPIVPTATPKTMSWYGRLVSLVAVVLALVVGLAWNEGISDLGKIQFPLTVQVILPFLIGLFANEMTDVHPWCITTAMISSSLYVVGIYFGYLRIGASTNPLAIDSGITGVCLQAILIVLFETLYRLLLKKNMESGTKEDADETTLLHPNRPAWDIPKMTRFGTRTLTPDLIWRSMDGFYEPMANGYWNAVMFLAISFVTPLVAPSEPPLSDDGTFLYLPNIVNGLPWWVFKAILLSIVPYIFLLTAISKVPDNFPVEDEAALAKKGIDVHLVDLTLREQGRRRSYDEPNALVQRRRSSISSTMAEMGIHQGKGPEEAIATPPSGKRLSNLVFARELDILTEDQLLGGLPTAFGGNDKEADA